MSPLSRLLLAAATLLALPVPALAEGGISLAVAGGGIGIGPVAGVRLAPGLGLHGDAALLAVSHHFQSGPVQDTDHLRLRTAAAMVDLFPVGGSLRLSLGARYEGEQAPLGLRAAVGRGRRDVGWTSVGPAATLGWTRRLIGGLVAVVEGGAMLRRETLSTAFAVRAAPILNTQLAWHF